MYSELFQGEIIYTKRFPIPDEVEDFMESKAQADSTPDAEGEASAELMRRSDENCVYVFRPDKLEFCQQFIDYAKKFSEQFEVGIDVVSQKFSYLVRLYIDLAHFRGRYKEMMQYMMIAADEFYFDPPGEEPFDLLISFTIDTHDLYYDGKRRILN